MPVEQTDGREVARAVEAGRGEGVPVAIVRGVVAAQRVRPAGAQLADLAVSHRLVGARRQHDRLVGR